MTRALWSPRRCNGRFGLLCVLLTLLLLPGFGSASQQGTSGSTGTNLGDDVRNTTTQSDPTTLTQGQNGTSSTGSTTAGNPNPTRDGTEVNPGGTPPASTPPPSTATPNPGDLADDLVRAEAERQVGAPLAVLRLDNPAFVFSSADPEVAAGVKAWLATLKGPHDQYGNFMGPGYRGSFRPDSVNKQLVEFLAKYLNGKRLVAVSADQATSLASLQTHNRQAAIEQIVRTRREQASNHPAAPTTGSGGRENVPNIGNGGDNRNGNGNSGTTTGSGTGTNPTTTAGNPNTGSTTGSTPSTGNQNTGSFTPSSLEARYPSIKIQDQPKAWTSEELGQLNDVLSKLNEGFWKDIKFSRSRVISIDGTPDENIFGVTITGGDDPMTRIEISDRSFSDVPEHRLDFPTPPYPDDQSKSLQFMGTIAHELTHRYLRYEPGGKYYEELADNPLITGEGDGWATKFGWSYDPTTHKWALDQSRRGEPPTIYAGTENPSEDMAESVMLYLYDPQRLRASSPDRYNFIRDKMGIREQPDSAVTYPPPRNDPRYRQYFASGGSN